MIIFLLIMTLILILYSIYQNNRIKILENNCEVALRVIGEYDKGLKEYLERKDR